MLYQFSRIYTLFILVKGFKSGIFNLKNIKIIAFSINNYNWFEIILLSFYFSFFSVIIRCYNNSIKYYNSSMFCRDWESCKDYFSFIFKINFIFTLFPIWNYLEMIITLLISLIINCIYPSDILTLSSFILLIKYRSILLADLS